MRWITVLCDSYIEAVIHCQNFFADRCALREPEVVEKIQWKILQSFIHLINKTHPHEPLRFARCMDKITQMRELTDLNYKANKNLENFQKSLIQNYPLLYECVTYEGWFIPIPKCKYFVGKNVVYIWYDILHWVCSRVLTVVELLSWFDSVLSLYKGR